MKDLAPRKRSPLPPEPSWRTDPPGGSDHSGQQSPLLLHGELHDSRGLKLLPDPLALLHVVDEHELDPDVLTVRHLKDREGNRGFCNRHQTFKRRTSSLKAFDLKPADDFSEGQSALFPSDEGGFRNPEHSVHVAGI